MNPDPLISPEALARFIEAFNTGIWPKEFWTHRAHVIMAACYLLRYPAEEALPIVRERIKAYNLAQGGQNTETSGYHESLTVFWLRVVAAYLAQLDPAMSDFDKVRMTAEQFATRRDIFKSYWSFDVVKSVEARREWVPPDLLTL